MERRKRTVTASPLVLLIVLLIFNKTSNAQLCTGSLGDPVVNITFGSGNSGNTGYTPTNAYTYINSTCPDDGYYTITSYTSGCFSNSWHTVNSDHTGNGNFMLVNASYEPGDFLVTTVSDLCPNTTYQFSAWLVNVLVRFGIRPNITFSIEAPDGTLLGQYSTGDIPETPQPAWKEYGLFFKTPPGNPQIVLRMTNNAPGGIGNDLGLDDITFRPCGPPITATIKNNKDTVDVCEGNTGTYNFSAEISTEFQKPLYQWQVSKDSGVNWTDIPGANSSSYVRLPSAIGFYWYRLAVNEESSASFMSCRTASNAVVINVHKNPVVDAGPDRIIIGNTPAELQGKVTGEPATYKWSPPDYLNDNNIINPLASPPVDFKYALLATSVYGCNDIDEVTVKKVDGIFVPTAFTPNNDGVNDTWRIPYLDPYMQASVNIYNRYGRLVYHAEGKNVEWDGTFKNLPQPSGTYVYIIHFKKGFSDIKGLVVLIR